MGTPRSGLGAQLMIALETTYGLWVTPTVGLPLVPGETLEQKITPMESAAVIAGRRIMDPTQWALGALDIGGDTPFELYTRSLGKIFKLLFGAVATSGSDPYTHTFTPGDLTGISATLQKGVPGVGGTVFPLTYGGAKIASAQIACKEGQIATMGVTWAAQTEVGVRTVADGVTTSSSPVVTSATAAFGPDDLGKPVSGTNIPAASYVGLVNSATSISLSSAPNANTPVNASGAGTSQSLTLGIALAAASYAAGASKPFHFDQGVFTLGGVVQKVTEATLNFDNMFVGRRGFLGQRFADEPLEGADLRKYDGDFTCEFSDRTVYNRFLNGVEASLVLAFTSGTDTLTITENVRFDGESPKVASKGIITQKVPFKADGTTDAGAVTAVLVDHDATV